MAQMETADSGRGKKGSGGKRGKKMSTRVDLTPMVDLAFLLITFFMLTTTMNKPQVMTINMPAKLQNLDDKAPAVDDDRVLTLILGADDQVWYYEGLKKVEIKNVNYKDIRQVILDKIQKVKDLGRKDAVVIIKPDGNCSYKNVVDILDEMAITKTQIYTLTDITSEEKNLIASAVKAGPEKG